MDDKEILEKSILQKLFDLNSDFAVKGSCIAWTTFPFSNENLDIVERSIKKLNWNKDEYDVNYDENLIFVEKDII